MWMSKIVCWASRTYVLPVYMAAQVQADQGLATETANGQNMNIKETCYCSQNTDDAMTFVELWLSHEFPSNKKTR